MIYFEYSFCITFIYILDFYLYPTYFFVYYYYLIYYYVYHLTTV